MPGPFPKDPKLRQRNNKASTRTVLDPSRSPLKVPKLPAAEAGTFWHPMAVRWWRAIWRSPMAHEYLPTDIEQLFMVVRLVNEYWSVPVPNTNIMAEIRQQTMRFGLSPIDRRRLEWTIAEPEEKAALAAPVVDDDVDPRTYLAVVS